MIRVRLIRQYGYLQLDCIGHAETSVCSAVSMIVQAAALGIRDLAKQFPKEIIFEADVAGERTDVIDSQDKRKPKRVAKLRTRAGKR